ncbi:lysoplasmalogenase [Salinibacterium sp. UTAS2018]|uniref:lysoplasmalogenase n=1 Tax=Salinibacterium sp. UTAS2018 TaxID=2508880 RepID=UPI0010096EBA|nr:lysoplasmalogenase [Salinibacterium sp. UTAS2018]QAV69038.1 lysoplasmalogenase [Salinibacterium sp. UTAS2018]
MTFLRGFIAYCVVATVHVVSLAAGWDDVASASKFSLMPALILGVVIARRRPFSRPDYLLLAALALSWLGDIFVADAESSSFLVGLAAFFGAHALYLVLFLTAVRSRRIPGLTALLIVWWVGLLVILRHDLGFFFIPLAVYGAVLAASTAAAFATQRLIAAGAVLFLASDTALAGALFSPSAVWWQSDVLIMSLYIAGQGAIAAGVVRARNAPQNTASVGE